MSLSFVSLMLSLIAVLFFYLAAAEAPAEEEEDLKITPRKAARQRGLEVARAMDTARGRDLRLQQDWVHSFPGYRPGN